MIDLATIRQLSSQGRHTEAMQAAARLLKAHPNAVPVLTAHGFVHINGGQFSIALKSYQRLLKMAPKQTDYLFALAICHTGLGQLDKAENTYLELLGLKPDDTRIRMNLGVLYRQKGDLESSVRYLQAASESQPENPEILHNLAITFEHQEHYKQALDTYARALQHNPRHHRALCNRGSVLSKLGQLDAAKATFESVLEIAPDYANAINNLGIVHLYQRNLEEAEKWFLKAIDLHPREGKGYHNLASLETVSAETHSQVFNRLEQHLQDRKPILDRDKAIFALARYHEKQKNQKKTEQFYRLGNDFVSRQRRYDDYRTAREFDKIAKISSTLDRITTAGDDGSGYIFIIGMPRSGTTLVESIIASHQQITAGDELPYMNRICQQQLGPLLGGTGLEAEHLARISSDYRQNTAPLFGENRMLIDKLPHNFKWAAVISKIFPAARILHCHRDPMDNCWSLYRANFEQGHNYCFTMKSLGQYYARYQQLMQYFQDTLNIPMLSVSYDALVADPEPQAARLFDYLGLGDYQFEEQARGSNYFSRTASAVSVQQPINTASLRGWQRHQAFLQPLLSSLKAQQLRLSIPLYQPTD